MIDLNEFRPKTDIKDYRLVELSNGIPCLLISNIGITADEDESTCGNLSETEESSNDKGSDSCSSSGLEDEEEVTDEQDEDKDSNAKSQAAFAVSVGVGSFSDPEECQGLAHFLEHLLFMGSEKYPKENYFDEFVSSKGGFSNAYTAEEETVYYFTINPDGLFHAVDIVAQFFTSPILNPDAISRELDSIQSEFDSAKNHDSVRLDSLFSVSSKVGHPMAKFLWGNIESINCKGDTIEDLKESSAYKLLKKFYDSFYGKENMAITMMSPFSLDEMENQINKSFQSVRSCKLLSHSFGSYVILPNKSSFGQRLYDDNESGLGYSPISLHDILDYTQLRKQFIKELNNICSNAASPYDKTDQLFVIVPTKQVHKLIINFQLPSVSFMYRSKPEDFIAHLIGNECKGTILDFLKQHSLANGIMAGLDSGSACSAFSIFQITVDLTPQGVQHVEQVLSVVFEYLSLIEEKLECCKRVIACNHSNRMETVGSEEVFNNEVLFGDEINDKVSADLMNSLYSELLHFEVTQQLSHDQENCLAILRTFKETKDISKMSYMFLEDNDASDMVSSLAEDLIRRNSGLLDSRDILSKEFLIHDFDVHILLLIASSFKPKTGVYYLMTSSIGTDQDYLKVEFTDFYSFKPNKKSTVEELATRDILVKRFDLTEEEMSSTKHFDCKYWQRSAQLVREKTNDGFDCDLSGKLSFPAPNRFIPTHFEILNSSNSNNVSMLLGAYVSIKFIPNDSEEMFGFIYDFTKKDEMLLRIVTNNTNSMRSEPLAIIVKFKLNVLPDEVRQLMELEATVVSQNFNGQGLQIKILAKSKKLGASPQITAENLKKLIDFYGEAASPRLNDFIPNCFSPSWKDSEINEQVCIFQMRDYTFLVPKCAIMISLVFESAYHSSTALNSIMTTLLAQLTSELLNDEIYAARLAQTRLVIAVTNSEIQMKFTGYNHKLLEFAQMCIDRFFNFAEEISRHDFGLVSSIFDRLVDKLTRTYENIGIVVSNAARKTRLDTLYPASHSKTELLEGLKKLKNITDLTEYSKNLFGQAVHMTAFVHGNFSEQDVQDLRGILFKQIKTHSLQALLRHETTPVKVLRLQIGKTVEINEICSNDSENNNCVSMLFEIGEDSLKLKAILYLLEEIMTEPLYDELRTKQQLGYSVSCRMCQNEQVLGFLIKIVSATFSCKAICQRIECFLLQFQALLKSFEKDRDKFNSHKASLTTQKLVDYTNLKEETHDKWAEILRGKTNFYRSFEEAAAIQSIKLEDILEVFETLICPISGGARKKLVVNIHSVGESANSKPAEKRYVVDVDGQHLAIDGNSVVEGYSSEEVIHIGDVRKDVHSGAFDYYQYRRCMK